MVEVRRKGSTLLFYIEIFHRIISIKNHTRQKTKQNKKQKKTKTKTKTNKNQKYIDFSNHTDRLFHYIGVYLACIYSIPPKRWGGNKRTFLVAYFWFKFRDFLLPLYQGQRVQSALLFTHYSERRIEFFKSINTKGNAKGFAWDLKSGRWIYFRRR